MHQYCSKCERGYNDLYHLTTCPHKGIGFCAVCDCTMCVCDKETSPDWERSSKNMERQAA